MIYFIIWLIGAVAIAYGFGRWTSIAEEANGEMLMIPISVFWPLTLIVVVLMCAFLLGCQKAGVES